MCLLCNVTRAICCRATPRGIPRSPKFCVTARGFCVTLHGPPECCAGPARTNYNNQYVRPHPTTSMRSLTCSFVVAPSVCADSYSRSSSSLQLFECGGWQPNGSDSADGLRGNRFAQPCVVSKGAGVLCDTSSVAAPAEVSAMVSAASGAATATRQRGVGRRLTGRGKASVVGATSVAAIDVSARATTATAGEPGVTACVDADATAAEPPMAWMLAHGLWPNTVF